MTFFKKWSKWEDLSIGVYSADFYLLQAKRRSDGKVKFRVARSSPAYNAPAIQLNDLAKIQAP